MTTKQLLKKCQIFAALNDSELEKIVGFVSEKQYDAGTTIFQEGDSAEELMILQEGKIAGQMTLSSSDQGTARRITVDVIDPNEVIGWSALVEPYTYTLTAVCLEKVKVVAIPASKLRRLLQDDPRVGYEVVRGLIRVVASRLDDTRKVLVSERFLPSRTV
ncbi:MAG: cyclic nucleotide-binding domain-containing protein [Dehalococcoidia bacterium]|nr:cyclic nucleotide-binding domain-containing protein [Dehalococcoidales bacterium]MDZ4246893.1 cyclic nucleotide-binding domain-containing protein [Dehalococcoidia bacterium]